jgi:predicted metal-dependent phosphoesterase TrpH
MNLRRRAAWLVVALGLLVGTAADVRTSRTPVQRGEYVVLAAGFHLHGFFGDGSLPPWDMRREAERRGLDAIAITNHNQVLASRLGAWVAGSSPGPIVLTGEEVTAPHYHLVALGTTRAVDWRQPLARVIDDIHSQGGVAIAAHPTSPSDAFADDEVLTRLDGLEGPYPVGPPRTPAARRLQSLHQRARSMNPHVAVIGGSDFHVIGPLSTPRTLLLARERTAAGILEAIRAGRTAECMDGGRLVGTPEMVRLLKPDCPATADVRSWQGGAARIATGSVWAALTILVLVAGPVREP